jgi:PadR family transcriptional regulator, regulatory protein PadR
VPEDEQHEHTAGGPEQHRGEQVHTLCIAPAHGRVSATQLQLEAESRYGVELVTQLAAQTALTTSEGTLYPLLSRLRRSGWVATTWQESPAGPPRRYYELTRQGKEALAHFRSEWVAFRTAVDRIVGTEHT